MEFVCGISYLFAACAISKILNYCKKNKTKLDYIKKYLTNQHRDEKELYFLKSKLNREIIEFQNFNNSVAKSLIYNYQNIVKEGDSDKYEEELNKLKQQILESKVIIKKLENKILSLLNNNKDTMKSELSTYMKHKKLKSYVIMDSLEMSDEENDESNDKETMNKSKQE